MDNSGNTNRHCCVLFTVTLMCLLYFRIYRETVKRRKELHLLQAQHQTSYAQPTANNN